MKCGQLIDGCSIEITGIRRIYRERVEQQVREVTLFVREIGRRFRSGRMDDAINSTIAKGCKRQSTRAGRIPIKGKTRGIVAPPECCPHSLATWRSILVKLLLATRCAEDRLMVEAFSKNNFRMQRMDRERLMPVSIVRIVIGSTDLLPICSRVPS